MIREKTAVEFLYEFVLLKLTNEQQMQFEGLFHQAKQMEKEQIEESFNESRKTHPMIGFWWIDFQDYYESKYGKDENKSD